MGVSEYVAIRWLAFLNRLGEASLPLTQDEFQLVQVLIAWLSQGQQTENEQPCRPAQHRAEYD
jgi:hypothetical protein